MNYKNIRWDRVGIVLAFIIAPIVSFSIWGIVYGTEKIEPAPTRVVEMQGKSDYEKRMTAINQCVSNMTYETSMNATVAYRACSNIYDDVKSNESEEK